MKGIRTLLVASCLLLAAGCGGDSTSGGAAPTDGTGSSTVAPSPSETASTGGTVAVASTSLGDVLVGENGMTLYMFDPDKQAASTCYEQCEQAWPPLVVTGDPVAGDGVDAALLGVVARTDGTQQVTYDKWPLYFWAQDQAPGDVTGQGVNNVWWVLDAAGQPIK